MNHCDPLRMPRLARLLRLALIAPLLCAAGCSVLETKQPVAQVYALAPALPTASAEHRPASVTIKVLRPLCAPGLDTDNMALTRSGQRFDFYAHSRWAATVPELVQASVVDALRAAGHFRAVQSDLVPLDADYLLQLEIRRFQAEYQSEDAPVVRVQLVATLGRGADRSLISNVVVAGDVPAGANRMQNISAAFESALGQALAQLAQQVQPPASASPSPAATSP